MTWETVSRDLVKPAEGLRLVAYQDPKGIWTIGWGSTRGVTPGMRITVDEAEARLDRDIALSAIAVDRLVEVPLTAGQKGALVSFVFNLGAGRLAGSTLLTLLNQGHYREAAEQILLWVHAGKVVLPGLVARRKKEHDVFLAATA